MVVTLRPSIEIAADVTATLALSVNGVASITPSQVAPHSPCKSDEWTQEE